MKFSIIIPVNNEENTLEKIVDRVFSVSFGEVEREVIVANDGSQDRTSAVIQKLKDK